MTAQIAGDYTDAYTVGDFTGMLYACTSRIFQTVHFRYWAIVTTGNFGRDSASSPSYEKLPYTELHELVGVCEETTTCGRSKSNSFIMSHFRQQI